MNRTKAQLLAHISKLNDQLLYTLQVDAVGGCHSRDAIDAIDKSLLNADQVVIYDFCDGAINESIKSIAEGAAEIELAVARGDCTSLIDTKDGYL